MPVKKKKIARKKGARGPGPKRGVPPLLNPKTSKQICDSIRRGNWMESSAEAAGVTKDTLYVWLRRGKKARKSGTKDQRERVFVRFLLAVRRAQAEADESDWKAIDSAKGDDWRAAQWKLTHRHPGRFAGPPATVNIKQTISGRVSVDHRRMLDSVPVEDRMAHLEFLRKKRKEVESTVIETNEVNYDAVVDGGV